MSYGVTDAANYPAIAGAIRAVRDSFVSMGAYGDVLATKNEIGELTIRASSVPNGALRGLVGLEVLSIPNVECVQSRTFAAVGSLRLVDAPACREFKTRAFYSCSSLERVQAPLCERIGESAFMGCALTEVSFPRCVSVGNDGLRGLRTSEVFLPSCTTLGSYAFGYCHSITTVSLPVIERFNGRTFAFCPQLSQLYMTSVPSVPTATELTFMVTALESKIGSIYVPASLYSDFLVAPVWSSLASIIVSV